MQGNVSQSPASSRAFNRRSFTPTQREKMANEQHSSSLRPWLLDAVPFVVVLLIAAHVLALVYWIYRLATEKQPQRRKAH
ncbi:hypothetical protein RGQ29_010248 [Quercus rubra]|uniref:Transmembrane protein n=1 Tax=Quercus rubra TaxID=3512 RepID=A0AAN7J6Z1_QUERU|nr:hypothetical protein RGQ29_010248 [Quercus rubra]